VSASSTTMLQKAIVMNTSGCIARERSRPARRGRSG
jgi:hypothetical protein